MNLPNRLTTLRVILIPFFIVFLMTGLAGEASRWIALGIFAAASFTDFLDGYIARKKGLITNFGKFMDPLADKLLVCSAMLQAGGGRAGPCHRRGLVGQVQDSLYHDHGDLHDNEHRKASACDGYTDVHIPGAHAHIPCGLSGEEQGCAQRG